MAAGVNLYNDKKYAEAAAAFEKLTATEPNNRDALSNLSNAYLALNNGPKLLDAATRLVAIEPLSENALKLQREGYRLSKKVDQALKVQENVMALPADVKVDDLTATGTGATLTATATGRAATTPSGKPVPSVAVPIVVEFLNASGGVVATQDAQVPALKEGASQPIKVTAQGAGVTAWRYRRK
jgi:tetratricopeptide (TPR) repeat protein